MPAHRGEVEMILEFVNEHLIGAKITGTEGPDEDDFFKIIVETVDGQELYIEPSMDAEGNGPGFLFFGE